MVPEMLKYYLGCICVFGGLPNLTVLARTLRVGRKLRIGREPYASGGRAADPISGTVCSFSPMLFKGAHTLNVALLLSIFISC